jgi:hypothetical protein
MERVLALQALTSTTLSSLDPAAAAGSGDSNVCSSETNSCSSQSIGCKGGLDGADW